MRPRGPRHAACSLATAWFALSCSAALAATPRTLAQGGLICVTSVAEAPRQASSGHRGLLSRGRSQASLARARLLAVDGDRATALSLYRDLLRHDPASVRAAAPQLRTSLERPGPAPATAPAETPTSRLDVALGQVAAGQEDLWRTEVFLRDERLWPRLHLAVGNTRVTHGPQRVSANRIRLGWQRAFPGGVVFLEAGRVRVQDQPGSGLEVPRPLWTHRAWLALEVHARWQLRLRTQRSPVESLAGLRTLRRATLLGVSPRLRLAPGHTLDLELSHTTFDDRNQRAWAEVQSRHRVAPRVELLPTLTWARHVRASTQYWSAPRFVAWSLGTALVTPTRHGVRGRAQVHVGWEREDRRARPWGALAMELAWKLSGTGQLIARWAVDPRPLVHDGGHTAHGLTVRTGWGF